MHTDQSELDLPQMMKRSTVVNLPKRTNPYAAGRSTSEYVLTAVSIVAGAALIALAVLANVPETIRDNLLSIGGGLIGVPVASYGVTRAVVKGAIAKGAASVETETIRKQPRSRRSSKVAQS